MRRGYLYYQLISWSQTLASSLYSEPCDRNLMWHLGEKASAIIGYTAYEDWWYQLMLSTKSFGVIIWRNMCDKGEKTVSFWHLVLFFINRAMVVLIFRNPTITLACACCLHKVMQEYQRLAQKSFLQQWKKLFYHPRWLFLMHYSWEVGVKLKQINMLKVKETQQIWRAYMSLSLLTEECMMKPVTLRPHTTFVKLSSSSTTRSGTRSRIFWAASDVKENVGFR